MTASQHTHASPESFLTPPMRALENAGALDSLVSAADTLSSVVTGSASIRDLLRGKRLGHAVHPLLVQVPMGTWLSALVLDAVGGRDGRGAARLLTGVGVLSAGPSALTGWAEYSGLQLRDKRVTVVHAGANGAATALHAASWLARRSGRHGLGRALSLGGMTAAGLGGYLGGHLSVSRQVGSRDAAFEDGTNGRP
ncbi:DUF2231 domain-containing protein [Kocuria tytonicola]|nr:DUF2231 domain-containing protein [Kocuria tytonicola]